MTIAKFRPRCSSPISSRMNGNFWTVVMMIFLPPSMNSRRSPERSACADGRADLRELLDRVANLLVEDARSVTTMIESKTPASSRSRPISWCASQAIEFDLPLPAECWIR